VNMELIMTWARQIESKHALFLFDSCFSGTIFKAKNSPKLPKYIDKMVAKPVRQFISAGSADEVVPAKSVFTPAFIDAVREAKADFNQDGFVTGIELGIYLVGEVPKYEDQTPQFGKIKDYELAQGDFVFAVGDSSRQLRRVGIDEDYYNSLETSALLSNAKTAYEKEDYEKALAIYSKAAKRKDGQLMDTYIGLYVTAKELDNSDIQEEAYAKFVEIAFANNRLSSLFLFEVNGTKFKSEKKDEYELWLRKIAEYLIENDKCFNIVGHDSKTRDREYSIKLSRQRAETIQAAMIRKFPQIAEKSKASGEGFDRCKVCSGTNDTKDEVDRRVEFTVVDCSEI